MKISALLVGLSVLSSTANAMVPLRLVDPNLKLPAGFVVKQGTFRQKIDHSDPKSKTFTQRYFVSTSYSNGNKAAPVFYIICGEEACGGIDIAPTISLAQSLHANLVALEHRYYGSSQPFAGNHPLSNEHLRYLTMHQALEDLAEFQTAYAAMNGWTGEWIAVGGSYPGALAAYYRTLHPELVAGALASSGTVHAEADFYEYDKHVAEALGDECLKAVKKVIDDVESKIANPATKQSIKALFKSTDVTDDRDFLYVVGDMLGGVVQYGAKDFFCQSLLAGDSKGQATQAYADAAIQVYQSLGYKTPSYGAFGSYLKDDLSNSRLASMRGWMYESCNEFGFYQTVNPDMKFAARSAQITLDYHNEACKRMFGITEQVQIERTNAAFFDPILKPQTSNILFVNGSVDPFSEASITPDNWHGNPNPNLTLFVALGGSHCEDLFESMKPAILQAQALFAKLVGEWLK